MNKSVIWIIWSRIAALFSLSLLIEHTDTHLPSPTIDQTSNDIPSSTFRYSRYVSSHPWSVRTKGLSLKNKREHKRRGILVIHRSEREREKRKNEKRNRLDAEDEPIRLRAVQRATFANTGEENERQKEKNTDLTSRTLSFLRQIVVVGSHRWILRNHVLESKHHRRLDRCIYESWLVEIEYN